MRISDWSSDVCSSDLARAEGERGGVPRRLRGADRRVRRRPRDDAVVDAAGRQPTLIRQRRRSRGTTRSHSKVKPGRRDARRSKVTVVTHPARAPTPAISASPKPAAPPHPTVTALSTPTPAQLDSEPPPNPPHPS